MAKWLWKLYRLHQFAVFVGLRVESCQQKHPNFFFEMVAQLRFIMINKLEDPGSTEPNTHLKDVINISIISKVTVTHFEVTVTRSFKVKVQEQPPLRYSFLVGWVNQPILNNMIVKIGS